MTIMADVFSGLVPRRLAVAGVLAALAVLAACDDGRDETVDEAAVRPVRVAQVVRGGGVDSRQFPATIQAAQTSRVSFQVPGKIDRFPVRQGETVQTGQLIAGLDPTDYDLALRTARVEAEKLAKQAARKRILRSEGHVAQAVLDDAQAAYDQAAVQVEQAEKNLAETVIRAPFRAVVAERLVDRFVNVQAGEPVVLLQDISTLEVVVDAPERLIAKRQDEDVLSLQATLSAVPGRHFPLTIKEIATEPNRQTRTYAVTLSMPNPPDLTILPGMSATVTVQLSEPGTAALTVPAQALDAGPDGSFRLWIFDADSGTVTPRAVKAGPLMEDRAVILSGVEAGETVVAAGVGFLADGQRVKPVAAAPDR
jgi:RND family efflux transporter MFP subunit